MRKITGIIFLSFIISILSGCIYTVQGKETNVKNENYGVKDCWRDGDLITVQGEAIYSSYHSLNFLNENTGWVIRDKFDNDNSKSQLLGTINGGENWDYAMIYDFQIIDIKFLSKSIAWAITKRGNGNGSFLIEIQKTDDAAMTWKTQWEKTMDEITNFDLGFSNDKNGYVLINDELLMTKNGGEKWAEVPLENDGFKPEHFTLNAQGKGWAAGIIKNKHSLLILKTNDYGLTWEKQFEKGFDEDDDLLNIVDINFINDKTGWFLTSDLGTWMGELYRTDDGGETWVKINEVKSVRPNPRELFFINSDTGWIPTDVGAGPISGGLLYTDDGGKKFDYINNDSSLYSMKEVCFISPEMGWAISSEPYQQNYIVKTVDGGKTWRQVNPGIRPTQDISFIDNELGYGISQLSDYGALLYTENGGGSWESITSLSDQYYIYKVSFADKENGWALASKREDVSDIVILRTNDGGLSWNVLDENLPKLQSFSISYFKLFDKKNGIVVVNDEKINIYRTHDGGLTWERFEHEKLKGTYSFSFISTDEGWNVNGSQKPNNDIILNHMAKESKWQSIGQIDTNSWLYGVSFATNEKGFIVIQTPPLKSDSVAKLLVTENGGLDWTIHPFPIGFNFDYDITVDFTDEEHGWILSRVGLLKTVDGGRTWAWQ